MTHKYIDAQKISLHNTSNALGVCKKNTHVSTEIIVCRECGLKNIRSEEDLALLILIHVDLKIECRKHESKRSQINIKSSIVLFHDVHKVK